MTAVGRRISFVEYQRIEADNWSTLKFARTSLLHYKTALANPVRDTPELRFGRVVHCSVFEPLEFPKRYIVAPSLADDPRANRTTREGKAAWREWKEQHPTGDMTSEEWKQHLLAEQFPGREFLSEEDYERALACGEALRRNEHAGNYLSQGRPEVSIEWTDRETQLTCKARLDWLCDAPLIDCDLKTAGSISFRLFRAQAERLGYFHQLAFHRMGLEALTGKAAILRILAVESKPPFDTAVFDPSEGFGEMESAIESAEAEVRQLLAKVAHARKTGIYRGQYEGEAQLNRPIWHSDSAAEAVDEVPDGPITY